MKQEYPSAFFVYLMFLNIKSQQETKKVPHGGRKSMVGFEGLWAHNNF